MRATATLAPDPASMEPAYLDRFAGIGRLFGTAALPRLQAAHVAVIGVGGVGSWTVEALARSGIGTLTLIDLDDVCVTNTNRQLPALSSTIGRPKVEVLAERVRAIHPGCQVSAVAAFLSASNAEQLLAPGLDHVVDAVDAMAIKAVILDHCRRLNLPVITSGAAGGRRDGTQVRVADLGTAGGDPLLSQVRRQLRRVHGWPAGNAKPPALMGVPCVFSSERPVYPQADGTCTATPASDSEKGLRLDCAGGFGAAAFVTGAFGFALAGEVVRRLAHSGGN